MDLYTDSDAPTIERGVESRLRRLDDRLAVTWSKWSIHPLTSYPLEHHNEPIREERPQYHLWSRGGDGRWRYVKAYDQFGNREVAALEADVARRFSVSEILDGMERARQDAKERKQRRVDDRHHAMREANKSRMHDLLFEGKSGMRERKIISAPGVSCSSPDEPFLADAKEDGWEVPPEREAA